MSARRTCGIMKFYIYTDGTHAHTHTRPATAGQMWWNDNESEMTMKMRCKLLNQDEKRGTQKKREEQTPTGGRWKRNQTSGGGGRRKRLNQPTTAKPKRRTQPTCREEDTWDRGPMGDKLMKRCIHINVQSPLIGLNGHKIKSTLSTAVSGQNELRDITCTIEPHQSNQKERDHTWKTCPNTWMSKTEKVKPRTAARCFNTRPIGEKLKKGHLFHFT